MGIEKQLKLETDPTHRTSGDARSSCNSESKRWSLEGNTCSVAFFRLSKITQMDCFKKMICCIMYCFVHCIFFSTWVISNSDWEIPIYSNPKFNVCTAHLKVPHHHATRAPIAQLMPKPLSVGRMRCKRPPTMLPDFRWWFLCDYSRCREDPLQYAYSPGLFSTTLWRHGALPERKLKLMPTHECPEGKASRIWSMYANHLDAALQTPRIPLEEYPWYRFARLFFWSRCSRSERSGSTFHRVNETVASISYTQS